MSRHHLRHDKTCLNCGTIVEERYCTHCGQENTEPKESLGHLVGHFFEDITHFDSKIFTTLKDLVLRPGFLTREYIAGRRVRYLNPIRMYIFISAMFFLAMFAGNRGTKGTAEEEQGTTLRRRSEERAAEPEGYAVNLYRQRMADSLRTAGGDSLGVAGGNGLHLTGADSIRMKVYQELAARLDTAKKGKSADESIFVSIGSGGKIVIDLVEEKYHSLREYDSVQQHLPDSARNTGLWGWVMRRNVALSVEHGGSRHVRIERDLEHTIPKLMFVLLPLFALYTGWFYSRKKYYYVQHAIFSIHYHSFVFLLFLVLIPIGKLVQSQGAAFALMLGAYLVGFCYLVAALRRMYGQSLWLSLVKGVGIGVIYLVTIVVAFWVLLMIAFVQG